MRLADEKDLCAASDNMKLHKLFLKAANEEEPLRIDALSSPPCLEKLKLVGKLEKVACWFPSLHSVTFLLFLWSRLREDPLPCLQSVPNLARLIVVNAYVAKQLCFLDGFQKVKILNTYNCNQLNEIVLEKGVMPSLQILSLGRCMKLKALPHSIEFIIVREGIIECIRGEVRVDRQKVKHIPNTSYHFQTQSGLSFERLS